MENYTKNNRIGHALALRDMKKVELAEKTGIHKATISNWINQKYQPKQKSLVAMAKVLDVSELWLAGYDVPMERPNTDYMLTDDEHNLTIVLENNKYTDIASRLRLLSDDQLSLIENLLNQFNIKEDNND